MHSNRGFTLLELLVAMALIVILSAIGIPSMMESVRRNTLWQATETIGSQIRQARLKAISHNKSFKVQFNCPSTGQFRLLEVTGNPTIDTDPNRCDSYQTLDSGIFAMPVGVTWDSAPTLTVNSRGVYSGVSFPLTMVVTYQGYSSRSLTMSMLGQISYGTY